MYNNGWVKEVLYREEYVGGRLKCTCMCVFVKKVLVTSNKHKDG